MKSKIKQHRTTTSYMCTSQWHDSCSSHVWAFHFAWALYFKYLLIYYQVSRHSFPTGSPPGEIPDICLFVGCLTSQQHASVSPGRICSNNFTCCHTEIEVADPTFYLTQSQYTDTGPTSPSADPITLGAWQGSHWSANFWVTGMTRPWKIPAQAGFEPRIFRSRDRRLNH